ncbi:MAG: hypothetical protein Q9212_006379 [Teloschistes hypoglaucus]
MPRNQPMGMVLRDEDQLALQLQNEYYEAVIAQAEEGIQREQWGPKRWIPLLIIAFFILFGSFFQEQRAFYTGLSNEEFLFQHYNRCKFFCRVGRWWAGPNVTYPVIIPPAFNRPTPTLLPSLPLSSLSSRLLAPSTTTTPTAAAALPIIPEGLAMDREALLEFLDQQGSSVTAAALDRHRRRQEDWDMFSDKEEEEEDLNAHLPTGEDAYNTNHPNPHYGIHFPSKRPRHHQQQRTRARESSQHLPLVEEMASSTVPYAKSKAGFDAWDDYVFFNPPPPPPSTGKARSRLSSLDQDKKPVGVPEPTFLEELLQGFLLLMGWLVAVVALFGGMAWYAGRENRAKDRRVAEEKARQMEEEMMRTTGDYTTTTTTTTLGERLYNTLSGFSTWLLLDLGATIASNIMWWVTRCAGCFFVLRLCLFFTKEDYERDNAIDVTLSALVGFVVGCASISVPVIVGLCIYYAASNGRGGVRHDDGVEKCHLPGCGQPAWQDAPCPSIEGQGWCQDHWFHPGNTAANDQLAGLTTANEIRWRWSQSQGTWVYDNGKGNGKGDSRTASTLPTGHRFAPAPAHQAPPDPPTSYQWYSSVVGGEQAADARHHNPDAFCQHLPAPPRPLRPQYHDEGPRNYNQQWRRREDVSTLRPGMGMRGFAQSAEEDVRRFRSRLRSTPTGQGGFS